MNNLSDPFEILLKLALSEGQFTTKLQAEVEATFSDQSAIQLDPLKEAKFLNRLQQSIVEETVGQLIESAINQHQISVDVLLLETSMSQETLTALMDDQILVDSVPVKLLKRFMDRLAITFDRLEKAVWSTFEQLNAAQFGSKLILEEHRYYRKSTPGMDSGVNQSSVQPSHSTQQNQRTMLHQYLTRLKQLY